MATAIVSSITGTGVSCDRIFPPTAAAMIKTAALRGHAGTQIIGKLKRMAVGYGYQTKRLVVSSRSIHRLTSVRPLRDIESTMLTSYFAS